jgi:hypothetical protein
MLLLWAITAIISTPSTTYQPPPFLNAPTYQPQSQLAVTPAPAPSPAQVEPEIRKLSNLRVNITNERACDKTSDEHYPHSNDVHDATFLFDSRHEDISFGTRTTINWAEGFVGTVPVCFVIDEKGMPQDITFIHSPGDHIQTRITEFISGLRFQPGTYEDMPTKVVAALGFEFGR